MIGKKIARLRNCRVGQVNNRMVGEGIIKQMKKGKAAGPSGVTVEMLQAVGEAGIRWVTEICNTILKDWKSS